MKGTIRVNLIFALIGFVITFLFAIRTNLPVTSLIRGGIGALVWFLLAFLFRIVLGALEPLPKDNPVGNSAPPDKASDDEVRGARLDMVTPDESDELNDLLKPNADKTRNIEERTVQENDFQPLKPPKLVSMKDKDAEELAKAVRHLTEDEGGR
ncbi:hypothetical protein [Saccharibacillus kuerlensis]|uniref:Uncharacterized protein n=1 Tax=Saccharibacillus kuerlensis TaxID=459527 RepID=A0ABQ2KRC7_9BACL|nr:hypothetical protein [Saccharibacillus kuerlensis]GGN90350.1 hypothetical protein GCM10010969_00740 [Saccharibacillus kuerlensis]